MMLKKTKIVVSVFLYVFLFSPSLVQGATDLGQRIRDLGRQFQASSDEISEASSLAIQGWRYTLPVQKSAQAAWGNRDGGTTWYYGYWNNILDGAYSEKKPGKQSDGKWAGDYQNLSGYYRGGGSPPYPTPIEKILSSL